MKYVCSLILLILILIHPLSAQNQSERGRIVRVMTFNILHGATTNNDFDLDAIARVILDADPDLVALQEVDFMTNRARKFDLATELGWRTRMAPLFGKAMDYDGGEYGEGILSKYSIIQSRNVPLPHSPGNEPRSALEILIVLPSSDTIAFVGTHLDHQDENDRIEQVKKINKEFTGNTFPILLAGDLNAIPGSNPINILEKLWSPTYYKNNPEPTFPSENPKIKIDYVMYFPRYRWKVLETKVIRDAIASDHCAYMAVLELTNEQKEE